MVKTVAAGTSTGDIVVFGCAGCGKLFKEPARLYKHWETVHRWTWERKQRGGSRE